VVDLAHHTPRCIVERVVEINQPQRSGQGRANANGS
jgi:hypothetical protein